VSDPDLAAQLALAAGDIADTAEARGALMTALVNLDPERRSDSDSVKPVQAVAFSEDGKLVVAASRDRLARVWAVGDPPSLAAPPIAYLEHPAPLRSAVFDPTGRFLATSSDDGFVRLWSVERLGRGDPPIRVIPGPAGPRGPLAFSRDGAMLATSGMSGTEVRLWNVTDHTNLEVSVEFDAHRSDVVAVAFSNDGRTLATAGLDGSAKLWDITDRTKPPVELWALDRGAGFVRAVTFSFDDGLLAIGNGDATATLWNVENLAAVQELPPLTGHVDRVTDVAFSPDSAIMATASLDGSARLWNVSNPARPIELAALSAGQEDIVYSVAFHPDRHTLAMSSQAGLVRLWETDLDRAAEEVCELTSRVITRDEWDRYLRGYRYEPPCSRPGGLNDDLNDDDDMETQPGSTRLVAAHSGKCVVIKAGVVVSGAPAYQFGCARAAAARWDLQRTVVPSPPDEDTAYRIRNASTDMCLDSVLSERRVGGASVVLQRPCVDDIVSQLWRFEVIGEGNTLTDGRFVNAEHGDCLNVNGNAVTDGAHLVRWGCGNGANGIFQVSTDALSR